MNSPLRVLILEDRREDALLMVHELRANGFEPQWQRVENEDDYLEHLQHEFDVILADYNLPRYDALRALRELRARKLDIPLIIVSGTIGEDSAIAAMREGASDYLFKDRLGRLGPAVQRVLEQKRLRDEKRRAQKLIQEREERFRALIEHSTDGITLVNDSGIILYASPSTSRILGYEGTELLGHQLQGLVHPADHACAVGLLHELVETPENIAVAEFRLRHKDGRWRWVETIGNNLLGVPSVSAIVANYRDITERKEIEETLRHYAARLQALSRRFSEVQEAERKLVAADLHDSVVQWLSGTLFRVEAARRLLLNGDTAGIREELTEIEDALQTSIRELRTTIMRLFPAELRILGLVAALSKYIEQWSTRSSINATFEVKGQEDHLSLVVGTGLYRICQEALNNVAKHARASKVQVTLDFHPEHVSLLVQDNGVGIDTENVVHSGNIFWYTGSDDAEQTHIGLLDMCERAQLLNGYVELQSAPGVGTMLSIQLPIHQGEERDHG